MKPRKGEPAFNALKLDFATLIWLENYMQESEDFFQAMTNFLHENENTVLTTGRHRFLPENSHT